MKKHFVSGVGAILLVSFALSSCDTPTGYGAGWGAATGALIGAAATGTGEGAAIGAGIGAATGALICASGEADQSGYYGGHPVGYYPYARPAGRYGFYRSPYTGAIYDLRGIPRGALTRD